MSKNWAVPEYSKKSIMRAGECLINPDATVQELEDATAKLSNWRAVHTYPMQAVLMLLRQKAVKIDKKSVVVQRLKRASSIIIKLERFESMKLSRMQDIAGCRAVVSSQSMAAKLKDNLLKSRSRNEIKLQKDYVDNPKDTGYRGYHLIVKYGGTKEEYSGLLVEIQIRTRFQHAWATSVEVVGTFIGRSLKTGEGHELWDEYFQLASRKIALIEKNPLEDGDKAKLERLVELQDELDVFGLLKALSTSIGHLQKFSSAHVKSSYFLLQLDTRKGPSKSNIEIWVFTQKNLEEGTKKYGELEKEFKDDNRVNIVLVAAESIDSLKKAYPNYFADTTVFLELMSREMGISPL